MLQYFSDFHNVNHYTRGMTLTWWKLDINNLTLIHTNSAHHLNYWHWTSTQKKKKNTSESRSPNSSTKLSSTESKQLKAENSRSVPTRPFSTSGESRAIVSEVERRALVSATLLIVLDTIVYLLIISSAINQISLIGFLKVSTTQYLQCSCFLPGLISSYTWCSASPMTWKLIVNHSIVAIIYACSNTF